MHVRFDEYAIESWMLASASHSSYYYDTDSVSVCLFVYMLTPETHLGPKDNGTRLKQNVQARASFK